MLALKSSELLLLDEDENEEIYPKRAIENFDLELGLETDNCWDVIIHHFKG